MSSQPQGFTVSNMRGGLQRDVEPFLLPNDAFPLLTNAYLYRGKLRKRFGSVGMGLSGNAARLVDNIGTPLNTPVMGLLRRELSALNQEDLIAFNLTTVNAFNTASGQFLNISGGVTWTGTNSDFFTSANFQGSIFVTNNIDPIRYYFGTTWVNFTPIINGGGDTIQRSLLVFPYKGRLVLLNTTEAGANFGRRARFSQVGVIYTNAPTPGATPDVEAWRQDIPGKGGFIDASTDEVIVGAQVLKDTLIIFFERSTWELRDTGNKTIPFVWERINAEHGSGAKNSTIPFDRGVLALGNRGIVSCDGVNLIRIDFKIPDEVFRINKKDLVGLKRVQGIRDFTGQQVIWSYRSNNTDAGSGVPFPDKNLVYNYLDESWAKFTNSYTAFGYYRKYNDIIWQNADFIWQGNQNQWFDPSLSNNYPEVVAGNQQGFVVFFKNVDPEGPTTEAETLFISTGSSSSPLRITSPEHNLQTGEFVKFSNIPAGGNWESLNGNVFEVSRVDHDLFDINEIRPQEGNPDGSSFPTNDAGGMGLISNVTGVPVAGGLIAIVPNFNIVSKRMNPFKEGDSTVRIYYVDLLLDTTTGSGTNLFLNLLKDQESNLVISKQEISTLNTGSKVWKRVYVEGVSDFLQLQLNRSKTQMANRRFSSTDVNGDPVETDGQDMGIHSFIFHLRETGGRMTR